MWGRNRGFEVRGSQGVPNSTQVGEEGELIFFLEHLSRLGYSDLVLHRLEICAGPLHRFRTSERGSERHRQIRREVENCDFKYLSKLKESLGEQGTLVLRDSPLATKPCSCSSSLMTCVLTSHERT